MSVSLSRLAVSQLQIGVFRQVARGVLTVPLTVLVGFGTLLVLARFGHVGGYLWPIQ
ncbi:hypothetical protein SAMN04487967_1122 [Natronorubrum sediminis]|uniref:Uncharacterized protein n=1 Tax=Natronorubrum sediminis TaxID=640943 RepID=A0A1H6FS84_9EURY|nr:hypothetical protein SAMN04487967_1122 [Natronorubrum sediminis]